MTIEGIDGAGKGTQTELLVTRLEREGFKVQVIDFPRYDTFIGKEIGERLSGKSELNAMQLPTKDMSLWYAVDRKLAFEYILPETQILILNRSTYSNIGFQLARKPLEEREKLKEWLKKLEFTVLGIPKPHKVFFLDITTEVSHELVAKKGKRDYVDDADVYEKNKELLQHTREVYLDLVHTEDNFEKIDCVENNQLRSIKDIHTEIWDKLLKDLAEFNLKKKK